MRRYHFITKHVVKEQMLKMDSLDDDTLDNLDELASRWAARAEKVGQRSVRLAQ